MAAIRVISKFVGQNRPFINTPFLNYIDYINKQMKMNKNCTKQQNYWQIDEQNTIITISDWTSTYHFATFKELKEDKYDSCKRFIEYENHIYLNKKCHYSYENESIYNN